ncbi:MAG: SMP-30/gluconolactonase/LRE family protein [Myxococcales bacterium]|nr:SMP-30/gluconolactonase/LRE family protein [Myxococcales bacterium]
MHHLRCLPLMLLLALGLSSCGTSEDPGGSTQDVGNIPFSNFDAFIADASAVTDSLGGATDTGELTDVKATGDSASAADACKSDDATCDGVDDDCDGETDEDAASGECDDDNVCTIDDCHATSHTCTHAPNDGSCDDGNACTTGDACKDKACVPGSAKTCTAAGACKISACDAKTGQCTESATKDGAGCDDGDPCTEKDACQSGVCAAGEAKDCKSDNPCLVASCDAQTGACTTAPAGNGSACDDGDKCTSNDTCKAGQCAGTTTDCDDKNPCTTNACKPAEGCTSTPNTAACDDGDACTDKDACAAGKCTAGTPKICDDSKPCTKDSCDKAAGACKHDGAAMKGQVCSDGSKCTLTDTCDDQGKCLPGKAKPCSDGKPCTEDNCDGATGACKHPLAKSGTVCDDGSYCTIGDSCDGKGECQSGKPVPCSDNNPCTVDGCDGKTGKCKFQNFPDGVACNDGDPCTVGDACKAAKCASGMPKACNDGNVCTLNACDKNSGNCTTKSLTGPCSDSNACTLDEVCTGGACKSVQAGTTRTIIGTGSAGFTNGAAKSARVYNPIGLDTARDGRVFVADRRNHRIRVFTPATKGDDGLGTIATFAGSGSIGSTNGAGTSARFYYPYDVAWHEASKTLYVADRSNQRIRKITGNTGSRTVYTLAGGSGGFADGAGTSARFSSPEGVAVSAAGVVYVADTYNHRIRRITPNGVVTTLAGTGSAGFTNGLGAKARFYYPRGLTVQLDGSVLVADTNNHRIRRVRTDGVVSTFAGSGSTGLLDGSVSSARFYYPYDVTVGPGSSVYVADTSNRRIRKIAAGKVTTFSGSGSSGYLDGPPKTARFSSAYGIAVDVKGRPWVSDYSYHRVRRLSVPIAACDDRNPCTADKCSPSSGCAFAVMKPGSGCSDGNACTLKEICTSAGQCIGKPKVCNDNNPCTVDGCNTLTGNCTTTKSSSVCNDGNACTLGETCATGVCKPPPTGTVRTGFGTGSASFTNGSPTVARVYYPRGLDHDSAGRIFLADRSNHRIRVYTPVGSSQKVASVGTYAGSGSAGYLDGVVTSARFYYPADVAWYGPTKTLYVADRRNQRIRRIAGGKVTTLAGSSSIGLVNGKGTSARFYYPEGITVSRSGIVYVSDTYNHAIRRITPTGTVTTLAGSKSTGYVNGIGSAARFNYPRGLTALPSGTLLIADSSNHRIRQVTPLGVVSLYAGTGSGGYTNGSLTKARFYYPYDIARGPKGSFVVADRSNQRVRKIAGGTVSLLAGSGSGGMVNGAPTSARFNGPQGVTVDGIGQVWVGDYFNHRVRVVGVAVAQCNDDNPCTNDSCSAKAGCIFAAKSSGSSCSDGDACTLSDVCLSGKCIGKTKTCNDGKVCTIDSCNATSGSCLFSPSKAACDDGNNCTLGDSCTTGSCKPQTNGTVSTATGTGSAGFTNGAASSSRVNYAEDLVWRADGRLLIADRNNQRIRLFTPKSGKIAASMGTFAGSGSYGYLDGAVTSARFAYPSGVAWHEGSKTLYIADRNNYRIRKVVGGKVSTLAGSGVKGLVNGAGSSARFYYPERVAVSLQGIVYVADTYNHAIRRILPNGTVTTLAGGGGSGSTNGTGSAARFTYPRGLVVRSDGSLLVADTYTHKIRLVTAGGTASTFAGSGSSGFINGALSSARFTYPYDVALSPTGEVLVADRSNRRIRRIYKGLVSTKAGSGSSGFLDGAATSARFNYPAGVAVGPMGQTWVADSGNHRIRVVGVSVAQCNDGNPCTTDSCHSTKGCVFAAKSSGSKCSDGNACTTGDLCLSGKCLGKNKSCNDGQQCTTDTCSFDTGACIFTPTKTTCNDGDACTVGERCMSGKCVVPDTVSTWIGSGTPSYLNGFGTSARIYSPRGMARAKDGTLYLADRSNSRIRRITASGVVSLHAGSGSHGFTNTSAASSRFYRPSDVAVSADGKIVYVADRYNHRIRRITGGTVTTLSGSGLPGFINSNATSSRFYYPEGIALNPTNGTLVVADSYNNRIRRVTTSGSTSTIAGSGGSGYKEGKGTTAMFYRPYGVDVTTTGIIYVADSYNHRIRRILADGTTQLVAGGAYGFTDGVGATASFRYPSGISIRGDGQLLVADRSNHAIRLIQPKSKLVGTIAGGTYGYTNGSAHTARFGNPYNVLALPGSNGKYSYLVSDYSYHRIRRVIPTPKKVGCK